MFPLPPLEGFTAFSEEEEALMHVLGNRSILLQAASNQLAGHMQPVCHQLDSPDIDITE
jgi:hypothetical protein